MLIPIADVPRWYAQRKAPGTVAVVHGDEALTWEDLERGANRRARAFAELGVKAGDFVAIGLPNCNRLFETTFAIWKLGAIPAPISQRLPLGEAAALLDILRPALLVGGEPEWSAPATVPADFVPHGVSDARIDGPISRYINAVSSGGSTGRPKVIVNHRPAVADTDTPDLMMEPGVSLLNPGPLYAGAPFNLSHYALFAGGKVTGMQRFDAAEALRLIEANRITWVNFVPTMMHRIWSLPTELRERYDLSSLKKVFHMSAPIPIWLKEQWIKWLGPERIFELYVGSELVGTTLITGQEWLTHKGSVGRIDPARIRILDENGQTPPVGKSGEIYFLPADGAGVTYHYLGAEPRTHTGGWESLGDIGHLDDDGYLYLDERRSDMILRGGVNVYPAEIEAALLAHIAIASCAVIGLPDEEMGNRIHAIIELRAGADASVMNGLSAFLSEHLIINKHPESFELVARSLRDDSGKVRRTALRTERIAWLAEGREFRRAVSGPPSRSARAASSAMDE